MQIAFRRGDGPEPDVVTFYEAVMPVLEEVRRPPSCSRASITGQEVNVGDGNKMPL